LPWPVIVKPPSQDGSIGIAQGSVANDQTQLNRQVAQVRDEYGTPVLVERFLGGREFNVAVIEVPRPRALPVAEVRHVDRGSDAWPLITYEAKWVPGSADDRATPWGFPDDLSPELMDELQRLAVKVFRLLGCRDYASVDFRLDASGVPHVLEVNPNPDYDPTSAFASALEAAELTHRRFTIDVVRAALRRGKKTATRHRLPGELAVRSSH
jgi:D-alanine-D-alanine ligase